MAGFLASVPCLELSDRFLQAEAKPSGEFRIFDAWLIYFTSSDLHLFYVHSQGKRNHAATNQG